MSVRGRAHDALVCGIATVAAAGFPAAAAAQSGALSLRVGYEQTSGDYGGDVDFDDRYIPLTLLYQTQRIAFRATVPYVEVEFVDPADSSKYTEGGLGDVVLGLTFYDALRSSNGSLALDLTGKIELPTADETKGLGTGETDYILQADLFKHVGKSTFVGSLGYKARGEPAGVVLEDGWLASIGGLYRFSTRTQVSLFVDYRESALPDGEAVSEAAVSLSRVLSDHWRLQAHLIKGLSDASLAWGTGFSVRRSF